MSNRGTKEDWTRNLRKMLSKRGPAPLHFVASFLILISLGKLVLIFGVFSFHELPRILVVVNLYSWKKKICEGNCNKELSRNFG